MEQVPDKEPQQDDTQSYDPQQDEDNQEQAPEQPDQASGTPDPNLAADGDNVKDGIEDTE